MSRPVAFLVIFFWVSPFFPAKPNEMNPGPKSPEASLKAMKLRPGFTVELMAAEPLVQSPIAFAWGPDGKFWVVEMGDYPLGVDGKGKPGGRIKFLEKTRGDGPYEKVTVFMEGLPFPTGVMPWGKGVLVTCAPDIFYAEDTDGDGKADKKVVLYTGFIEGNQQHRVNGLVYGLDNWIYGANGDSGGTIKSLGRTDFKSVPPKTVNISGRDFKIKPDLGLIDAVTGQSQFGRCRDDWGNWFGCNNSNPLYHYVLEDHYLRRNPYLTFPNPKVNVSVTPGAARVYPISKTLPRFNSPQSVNHFTSACSAIVYRDELFGPAFVNNTFVSEPVHNLIHREIMTARGVTFTSKRAADEQTSEFLASADNWFRPTMIQTGPDGALWVADMYRYVIEHPQWIPLDWQKKLDLRAGHDKGRIYRIYPVDRKPRAIPRLDKLSIQELVAALDSSNGWQRDMVQQMLVKMKDRSALPFLEKIIRKCDRPQARLHALGTLAGFDDPRPGILVAALKDPHPGVRLHAVRLCDHHRSPELLTALTGLVEDSDPQVRMQLGYTMGYWDDPRAARALAKLALRDHDNPYLLAAALSSVTKKNLGPIMAEVMKHGKKGLPAVLLGKLLILANAYGDRQGLAVLLGSVAHSPDSKYSPSQLIALGGLLDALDRQNTSLAKLGKEGNGEIKGAVQKLSGLFARARKSVADPRAPHEEQLLAVGLLGRGPDHHEEDMELLAGLLVPQTAGDLQAAALSALGQLRKQKVSDLILRNWKSYGPSLRARALDILLGRADGVQATLAALESKSILPLEIDAARRQRLVEHKQAEVRRRAAKLLAGTLSPNRRKVVKTYLAQVKDRGDPKRGAKIFAKTCAACHRLGGIGQQVGPELASVKDKSTAGLLNAILDPNQAVEARYLNYLAVTKNGLNLSGLLESETGTSITLVGPDGKKHVLLRGDLEELGSTGKSVMPEGLEKDISPADMSDLLAFIRSTTGPTKIFRPPMLQLRRKGSNAMPLTKPEREFLNAYVYEVTHEPFALCTNRKGSFSKGIAAGRNENPQSTTSFP